MTDQEKIQKIRQITLSPFNKINEALKTSYGDVDKAIKLLEEQKHTSTADMNNRVSNAGLVYSYVHQGRIGAMIVLACQTDFVARNPEFEKLAKDICMHIVSAPIIPIYADETTIPKETLDFWKQSFINAAGNKPQNIIDKIVLGRCMLS
jgi:elongation factor Ts